VQALTSKGYRVTAASSSLEALQTVKNDPPDLIITDLQLEDTDGMVLIEQLKAAQSGARIILLTGMYFEPEVVRENISKKVSCYLPKTSSLKMILQTIEGLL
jgi:CheY-like chemotaxis protein